MERMRMVDSEGREQATIDVAPMREGLNGRFISLARSDLAAALFGVCGDIPAHFGVSVASVEQDAGGVVATLSDGRQERFDLVVGADGLHSRVREIVFGPEPRFERFLETLVLLVCRADLIGADPPRDRQKEAVRRAFGDMGWEVPALLEGMDAADDLYFDRVSQIHLPRWSSGRIGLLGDAAACPSLLAGEGTGLAMTEAYVLAGELDRADGDPERALAAYERRLRPFVEGKQKAALWLRGFFAPQTALGLGVRSFTVRALSRPFLARRLFARSLRDDFELPGYSASR
jgi:2-polyprenyl-6-methoxyphenol hydroxylase-like FAD-dependent oxidoreductase